MTLVGSVAPISVQGPQSGITQMGEAKKRKTNYCEHSSCDRNAAVSHLGTAWLRRFGVPR
jgi:hypothetical protein